MEERRKESEAVTEHEDSHQGHVLSTARSASPSCWTSGELLAFRDVSISAGTPCLAFHGYTKTLPANSRTHPDFCFNAQFGIFFNATWMITVLTLFSNAQYMFGVQHYLDSTLMAAFIHRCRQYWRHRSGYLARQRISRRLVQTMSRRCRSTCHKKCFGETGVKGTRAAS